MSTATMQERGRDRVVTRARAPRERLVSTPLALVFLSEFCALTAFYLLLSVTPRYAAATGGSAGAGLVTGALLLGTVVAELGAPALMRRHGYRALLAAGASLLAVPALALLPKSPLAVIAGVSVVRGLGFGLSTVVTGALTAVLLPPGRRGEGLGLFGVVACVPGVVALPSGIWLAGRGGYPLAVCMAVVAALVPLALFPWLPGAAREVPGSCGGTKPAGLLAAFRHTGQVRLALLFGASTVAAGVVVSFLPLAGLSGNTTAAGLLAQALTATISRWWAGRYGDRHGHAVLLVPGLVIASAGMTAMVWLASPATVVAAMCLFGTGFGIVQNATFTLMMERMPASGAGTASALWNLAYDAGYGAGPAVFGLFAAHTGYPAAFALTAVLMLAALPAARTGGVSRNERKRASSSAAAGRAGRGRG